MRQSRKERLIEADNVAYARARGTEAIKMNTWLSNGWPDRLYVMPKGRVFWAEYKDPNGELSPLQAERIKYLRGRGHDVEVIDNKEAGRRAIDVRLGGVRRRRTVVA